MSNIFNTYNQYPIDIVAGHDWHLTDKTVRPTLTSPAGSGFVTLATATSKSPITFSSKPPRFGTPLTFTKAN